MKYPTVWKTQYVYTIFLFIYVCMYVFALNIGIVAIVNSILSNTDAYILYVQYMLCWPFSNIQLEQAVMDYSLFVYRLHMIVKSSYTYIGIR